MKTITFKTPTGEDVQVDMSDTGSTGKGARFLPAGNPVLAGMDPLTASRFMVPLLEKIAGVTLETEQKQTLISVLSGLPESATVTDLFNQIQTLTPEQYEPLAPVLKALQKMQEEAHYAGLFVKNDGN